MKKTKLLITLVLAALCHACAPGGERIESASLVLEHCRVVSMETSEVQAGSSLVIDGDSLVAVGPDGSFELPPGTARIDCEDRYVLPGLTDVHVHLGHPTELLSYLLAGVTTVVNLGGDHVDLFSGDRLSVLGLRDSVEAGELVGPTIYSSGQALDGDPATGPFQQALSSVDEALAAVEEQHAAGFDFIKVYDALDAERHGAIIDRAAELGMAVFGHVPETVGVEGALASGQAVVAHAEEFYPVIEGAEDLESAISKLAQEVARSGVAVIPNGAFVQSLVRQLEDLEQELAQPEVEYLAPAVRVWWEPRYNYYVNRDDPEGFLDQNRRRHAWIRQLVGELHHQEVLLLAGSDAAIPTALPGPSLHRELEELVESGLSNYQALRTATANVQIFMAEHSPGRGVFGTIAVGKRADLVVLEGNPLESLGALEEVTGVVVRGKWWATATLRDLREEKTEAFRTGQASTGRVESGGA